MAVTHASLTGAELHESKGVAVATTGQVYVADGSGSGTWRTLIAGDLPASTYYKVTTQTLPTTSGTAVDFTVPANTKRITVSFNNTQHQTNSSFLIVQIGNTTPESTGYTSGSYSIGVGSTGTITSGFTIFQGGGNWPHLGNMFLINNSGNTWVESHNISEISLSGSYLIGTGNKTTASAINILRVTSVSGNAFVSGSVTVVCESF